MMYGRMEPRGDAGSSVPIDDDGSVVDPLARFPAEPPVLRESYHEDQYGRLIPETFDIADVATRPVANAPREIRWRLAVGIAAAVVAIMAYRSSSSSGSLGSTPPRVGATAPLLSRSWRIANVSVSGSMPRADIGSARSTPVVGTRGRAGASIPVRAIGSRDADAVPSARPRAPIFVGSLAIDSDPIGATVFIDQKRAGETPLVLTNLRAGSHAVRLERNGYERWTSAVLVPSDRRTRVVARLQPQ
jgi:hypothetical protein